MIMKLLAYSTSTKQKRLVQVEPHNVKKTIPELMRRGYNRVLAKWKDDLFILEQIEDITLNQGMRLQTDDSKEILYTKTVIHYHPYQDEL